MITCMIVQPSTKTRWGFFIGAPKQKVLDFAEYLRTSTNSFDSFVIAIADSNGITEHNLPEWYEENKA